MKKKKGRVIDLPVSNVTVKMKIKFEIKKKLDEIVDKAIGEMKNVDKYKVEK
jgi:hypothetical protein